MAKIKQSLGDVLSLIMQFIVGREENIEEEALPTQRNQHFT